MIPIDPLVFLAFIPASLALNMTPGADMMFALGQGVRGGPRAGLLAAAGISAGGLFLSLIAGLGLGAVVSAQPWTFDVIRWIGVAYLLWLAWAALSRSTLTQPGTQAGAPFREAVVVSATNPKMMLFILAFIPQFIDPTKPILAQFLVFGLVIATGGMMINGSVGVFAGSIGQRLSRSRKFARILGFVSASVFAMLALRLAVMERA